MVGSLFSSDSNEPEKEGVEDKLGTLSGAYGQTPPVWPRASEGIGPVLNMTEARGLHSGGPGLFTPPSPSSRRSRFLYFLLGSGSSSEPRVGRMRPKLSGLDRGLMEPLTD